MGGLGMSHEEQKERGEEIYNYTSTKRYHLP